MEPSREPAAGLDSLIGALEDLMGSFNDYLPVYRDQAGGPFVEAAGMGGLRGASHHVYEAARELGRLRSEGRPGQGEPA